MALHASGKSNTAWRCAIAGYPYTNQVTDDNAKKAIIAAFDRISILTAAQAALQSTVDSLAVTTVQVSTNTGGVIPPSGGGTGLGSFNTGDLLVATTPATLAGLPDVPTGNALLSGGSGVPPFYGKVGLTTHVSGTLGVGSGGTNSTTALSGSTIMISNGSAIVQGTAGTTTTVLHGNAGGAPTYGAVSLTADVSGDLPYANLVPATAISLLLGRGSAAGAGDWQEITLGANLTMTGTVLSATGGAGTPGGLTTQVQFNDAGAFAGDADMTFVTDTLTVTKIASTFVDILAAANSTGLIVRQSSSTGYVLSELRNNLNSGTRNLLLGYTGSTYVGPFFTAGTGGEVGAIGTVGAFPLVFATSNNQRMILDGSSGKVAIGTTTIGTAGLAVMSGPLGVGATTTQGTLFEFAGVSGVVGVIRGTTAGNYNTVSIYNDQNNGTRAIDLVYTGSTYTGPYFTNGPTGEQGNLGTTGNFPLILGTQNIARITIAGAGGIVINEGGVDADVRMEGDTEANLFFLDASTDRIGIGTASPASLLTVNGLINTKNYTVATLPAGTRGDIAYVTDALAPAFLAVVVGGGAVVAPVFYNGANWVGF